MTVRARRGVTMLEVLTAGVIGTMLALPVITLLFTTTHEAGVSEDYMFAEALAQRALAEAMAIPTAELEARLPLKVPLEGVPAEDRFSGLPEGWLEEYYKNLTGPASFKGALTVRELRPGLQLFEVSLKWPTKPGASSVRSYALVRLRSRHDRAISTNFAWPKAALPGPTGTPAP